MPKMKIELGATLETLDAGELRGELDRQAAIEEEREHARVRGMSFMRLPQLQGSAGGGFLFLGQGPGAGTAAAGRDQSNPAVGPRDGFTWLIKRFMVTGLTTGATPDVVQIFADSLTSQALWQLTGNAPCATFGKFSMVLREGQTLCVANLGAFASTAQITLSGDIIQIPTVKFGQLM